MPDLDFQITGVAPATRGLTPLLHFSLEITNTPATETIHAVMLQAQIQIQATQRAYTRAEKENLFDLFGAPEDWGQTLRTRHWTQVSTTVPTFTGSTEAILPIPCTYDLSVAATKYFYALAEGDVPLLFLFSGTIFYTTPDGRVQVQPISWNKECAYRMPVRVWQEMMDEHYPNSAWLYLRRDVFDRLCAYKRRRGLPTWEQTIERLLLEIEGEEAAP